MLKGREFVLRSVDKNPTVGMSPFWRKTFLRKLVQDQTSVIHPYGYYLIPTLSEAAGVYYTNPKLVFVPDDPKLGEFRADFANTLAMLEERPQGEREDVAGFGNPAAIYSSRKAFPEIYGRPDHVVDATHYLRSRLFDIWLGDLEQARRPMALEHSPHRFSHLVPLHPARPRPCFFPAR